MLPFFYIIASFMNLIKNNPGFIIGLIGFLIVLLLPSAEGLNPEAQKTLALFVLMGTWWATEAVPVAITALVPLALFPLFGISSIEETAAPYANKIIYLFLGGFLIATAIQKWNLHKRIALFVLQYAGSSGRTMIGGFMLSAALISMWVMNTSTTIMLLPIGLAVVSVVKDTVKDLTEDEADNFQLALLLGIAYGATIGGMSTLIGTGPNGILAAFMEDNYGLQISFSDWMKVGVPLSFTMLPLSWIILTRFVFPISFKTSIETRDLLDEMKKAYVGMGFAPVAWLDRNINQWMFNYILELLRENFTWISEYTGNDTNKLINSFLDYGGDILLKPSPCTLPDSLVGSPCSRVCARLTCGEKSYKQQLDNKYQLKQI